MSVNGGHFFSGKSDAAGCRYNAVECNYIKGYHIKYKTAMTAASRASYVVSVVKIVEKTGRVITAPHCVNKFTLPECEVMLQLHAWRLGIRIM